MQAGEAWAVRIELGGRLGTTGGPDEVLMGLNSRSPAAHGLPGPDFLPLGVHARYSAGGSPVRAGVGPCQPRLSALTGRVGGRVLLPREGLCRPVSGACRLQVHPVIPQRPVAAGGVLGVGVQMPGRVALWTPWPFPRGTSGCAGSLRMFEP